MTTQIQRPGLTMANTPRPAADGMDCEVLRQQDLKNASQQPRHLRTAPPSGSRHRNLNTSPSSTSFSKVSGATYIPHEPVKGAVKAVTQSPMPSGSFRPGPVKWGSTVIRMGSDAGRPQNTELYKPTKSVSPDKNDQAFLKSADIGLSQNRITFEHPIKPQMTIADAVGSNTSNVNENRNKQVVKSIQVPFYNAPGHLSVKTYQTMDKYEKDKLDRESKKSSVSNIKDDRVILNMSPAKPEPAPEIALTIDTERRSIEGQITTPADTLRKEIDNLKDQLNSQTKINGELKKLLVASMGDDLHYRVECLVRANAQLAAEMGLYSNKISQDGENIDQLGIQADLWRSKYHASRVQVDELLTQRAGVAQRFEDACLALEELLQERYQLRDSLFSTYRVLQQLCDAFEPLPPRNRPTSFAPKSVTDIAARNYKLADNMKFRLLGAIQLYPALYNTATPNVMTAAEQMGIKILSDRPELIDADQEVSAVTHHHQTTQQDVKFSRYNPHPYARYDNVTFNCCRKCSGEIKIV